MFRIQSLSFTLSLLICLPSYAFTVSLTIDPPKTKLSEILGASDNEGLFISLGRSSGHEEITRQALMAADFILKTDQFKDSFTESLISYLRLTDLDSQLFGSKGARMENPILRGNYATDIPRSPHINWEVDLLDFYAIPESVNWHTNPTGQNLHFLKNFALNSNGKELVLEGDTSACYGSRSQIMNASVSAFELFKAATQNPSSPDREKLNQALFLLGHATHIIQDSFSPAHSLRSTTKNMSLVGICYYDPSSAIEGLAHGFDHAKSLITVHGYLGDHEIDDIQEKNEVLAASGQACLHNTFDMRDGIWIRSSGQKELLKKVNLSTKKTLNWDRVDGDFYSDIDSDKKSSEDVLEGAVKFVTGLSFVIDNTCHSNWKKREKNKIRCMKHSARLARVATAKYLVAIANAFSFKNTFNINTKDDLINYLNAKYFDGNQGIKKYSYGEIMPEGVFNCGLLKNKEITIAN